MNKSIATINAPEFINLQPLEINPLMSKCEIKVLYLGENRNKSYITKDVAMEMAKTLRGAPIVGYYKEMKEDFADHGSQIIFDDEGIHFNSLTKPYGFVDPNAKVWFQKFEDTDDFGNVTIREYMMTTGFLWTGQYEECQRTIDIGNNQSMELDEESLDGYWSTNNKTGIEFFIINDAIFSKLCILGEDVEPCFEGARITAPEVSTSFSKDVDDNFKYTLFNMMQELKFALEGGQKMDIENTEVVDTVVETPETNTEVTTVVENTSEESQNSTETQSNQTTDFAKDEDKKEKCNNVKSDEKGKDKEDKSNDDDKKDEEKDKKYALLEEQYNTLSAEFSALQEKCNQLVEFKNTIDTEKKDALINSFFMLTDEDKADVISNKDKYSLDEIEAKLSVICFRKGNFELDKEEDNTTETKVEETPITTFNLGEQSDSVPAWLKAVRNTRNEIQNK